MKPIAPAPWSPWDPNIFSLLVFAGMVCLLIAVLLFISGWLGEKRHGTEKGRAYRNNFV